MYSIPSNAKGGYERMATPDGRYYVEGNRSSAGAGVIAGPEPFRPKRGNRLCLR
jgi:hypothetical protein